MPVNPNSLANLQHTGRPKGSISKRRMIQEQFLAAMEKRDEDGGSTYLDEFLTSFLEEARKNPNSVAAKFVAERLFENDVLAQIENYINRGKKEDLDFLSYRIFKQAFNIQQQILTDKNRTIILMAGRRAGKTDVIQKKIADALVTIEGARVLYVAKTSTVGISQMFNGVKDMLDLLGIDVTESRRNEGMMRLANGSEFHIRGNTTIEDREKLRGEKWDLAVVDEAQSQAGLVYLVESILEPSMLDRKGQLILAGTGPRVRGTYFELRWTDERANVSRYNWNMTNNPFMPDHETILESIRQEKGLTESSPLYVREYLGKVAYDDDALVYRLTDANYYTDDELRKWIASQPISDIRFSAGLDYGFTDADGYAIILYSISKPERWLVYEYKGRRTGISELVEEIKKGQSYLASAFAGVPDRERSHYIYADSGGGGKKISYELATQYSLPCQDAYKQEKPIAIEMLQAEVRQGLFKVKKDGAFADEAMRVVFARNDRDELTREVDDETYHPDLVDAVLYAMRPIWLFNR